MSMLIPLTPAYGLVTAVSNGAPTFSNLTSLTNPTQCNSLFGLPTDTIQMPADRAVMNTNACAAYQYLITKYPTPGDCARIGLRNPRIQGITSLNTDFAIRLAQLMSAAEFAGYPLRITSAYRTAGPKGGQACANPSAPNSKHTKGLAVDLAFPGGGTNYDCSSDGYRWVYANAPRYSLALYSQNHTRYLKGECNHIEYTGITASATGPGAADTSAPDEEDTDTSEPPNSKEQRVILISAPDTNQQSNSSLFSVLKSLFSGSQQNSSRQNQNQTIPTIQPSASSPQQQSISSPAQTITQPTTQQTTNQTPRDEQSINQTSTSTHTSASSTIADLIRALAEPTSTTPTSSTPTVVHQFIPATIITLYPHQTPTSTDQRNAPPTPRSFTSPDLGDITPVTYTPGQIPLFQTALLNLKDRLLGILDRLNPFASTTSGDASQDTATSSNSITIYDASSTASDAGSE